MLVNCKNMTSGFASNLYPDMRLLQLRFFSHYQLQQGVRTTLVLEMKVRANFSGAAMLIESVLNVRAHYAWEDAEGK